MKKTAIALAMATVLGVAGTAMAANPFTDVPANHWSYASVAKLAQAGIVEGYGDGTFQGNNTMTRYEMAQIVAKAMARSDKADAAQKAMIEKLAAEYSTELNNLGVRVSALEKKSDNTKISAEIMVSRQTMGQNDAAKALGTQSSSFGVRSRIIFNGQINDQWSYYGRYQDVQNMLDGQNEGGATGSASGANIQNNGRMNQAWVQGPVGTVNTKIGRQYVLGNYGAVWEGYMDGVRFDFGNVVKTSLFYGKVNNDASSIGSSTDAKKDLYAANFGAKSGVVNLKAGYYNVKNNTDTNAVNLVTAGKNNLQIWELGFDTPVGKDLTFIGSYAKSNAKYGNYLAGAGNQDKNWKVRLNYKASNLATPHSYTLYGEYRVQEVGATIDPIGNFDYVSKATAYNSGFKGFMIGGNYILAKNIKWESEFYNGKATLANASDAKAKSFWNAVYFYF